MVFSAHCCSLTFRNNPKRYGGCRISYASLLVVCGTVLVRGVGHAISTKEDWGAKCHLCGKLGEKKLKCCSWQDKTEKPQKSTPFISPAPENRLMPFVRLRGTCSSSVPAGKGTLYWNCCKADVQGHIMSCVCKCRSFLVAYPLGLPISALLTHTKLWFLRVQIYEDMR